MARDPQCGMALLEERHVLSILAFLAENESTTKTEIYSLISRGSRMPDKLDALENRGRALQVFPASMPISSREVHRGKLEDVFAQGLAQGRAEAGAWERWLRG